MIERLYKGKKKEYFMSYRGLVGQSAIEYLMTYGWMLLVVAVTGSAIFAVAQEDNPDTVNGFSGTDVIIDNFGVTSDDRLQMELRSGSGEELSINRINVIDPDTDTHVLKKFHPDRSIGVGDSDVYGLPSIGRGSGNTLDVEIIYDSGNLKNLSISGELSGNLEINETREIQVIDGFETGSLSDYNSLNDVTVNKTTPVYSGSYRAEYDGGSFGGPYGQIRLLSNPNNGGNLHYYPQPGDRVTLNMYMEEVSNDQFIMEVGDSGSQEYRLILDTIDDEIELRKSGSSLSSNPLTETLPENKWIKLQFDWGESGQLEGRWIDSNGEIVDEVTATDMEYNQGNYLDITAYVGDTGPKTYVDSITAEPID